jgi:hypothetical protein
MPPEDQPMYYESKFTGEWKYKRAERYVGYQLGAFILVLTASLAILQYGAYIGVSHTWWGWYLFAPVIVLDLLFLWLEYDP